MLQQYRNIPPQSCGLPGTAAARMFTAEDVKAPLAPMRFPRRDAGLLSKVLSRIPYPCFGALQFSATSTLLKASHLLLVDGMHNLLVDRVSYST